jgi:glycogen synthase
MRRLAMARNFSWSGSALSYESVYARAIERPPIQNAA